MLGMKQPDLSVIIVSWNVRAQLESCLASLASQQGIFCEVIVVDNASHDGSADMVARRYPTFRLFHNDTNTGFAHAVNQGLTHANGRHNLLLNPDTVVPEGMLAKTVQYLDEHHEVGILGPKVLHEDQSLQRSVLRFPTLFSQMLVLLKIQAFTQRIPALWRYYAKDFDYSRESDVDQVMGSYFAFPRTVYEKIGPLDEKFYIWFEEVDYCFRVHAIGMRVRYAPTLHVIHAGGKSESQVPAIKKQWIFNHSMRHYFRKHHGFGAWLVLALLSIPSFFLSLLEDLIRPLYAPKPVR